MELYLYFEAIRRKERISDSDKKFQVKPVDLAQIVCLCEDKRDSLYHLVFLCEYDCIGRIASCPTRMFTDPWTEISSNNGAVDTNSWQEF